MLSMLGSILIACSGAPKNPVRVEGIGFVAEFPKEPEIEEISEMTALGEVVVTTYSYSAKDIEYAVIYNTYPLELMGFVEDVEEIYESAVMTVQQDSDVKVTDQKNSTSNGYEGKKVYYEGKIDDRDRTLIHRMFFIVEDESIRFYQVIGTAPVHSEKAKEMEAFIDSFQIIE
jgi:hypothetical protein